MRGFLKLTGIGNFGANPTLGKMPSGDSVVNFNLAVNESTKTAAGEFEDRVTWVKCHAFGDLADLIGRRCQSGTQVYVEGGFKPSHWVDNKQVEHSSFELRVHTINVLNNGKVKNNSNEPQKQYTSSEKIAHQKQREDVNAEGGFLEDQ